ncbi:hypothetical protein D3C71_2041000 [compost metagenome]
MDAPVEFDESCAFHWRRKDPLPDRQLVRDGSGADGRVIHRHVADDQDRKPLLLQRTADNANRLIVECGVLRQEKIADAEPASLQGVVPRQLLEKGE